MEFFSTFVLIIVTLILYVYWFLKKSYSYFDNKDFPTLKPTFILGNMGDALLLRKSLALNFYDLHKQMEPHKYAGFYFLHKPFVMFRDPDLIKSVLIKDFVHFHDHGMPYYPETDPMYHNLLRMNGDAWKNLRVKVTPIFTSGKMKMMFPLVQECARKLGKLLNDMQGETFNARDLCARYTTDVIGSCAFGIETNSLEDANSKFREMGERIFEFRYQVVLRRLFPNLSKNVVKFFNLKYMNEEVERFFTKIVENTVKYREENNITRYDFLDLLLALKNESEKYHDRFDDAEVEEFLSKFGHKGTKSNTDMTMQLLIGQCFLFFGAGFETSSTALGFLLLELALNKSVQDKVRQEVLTILANNDDQLTYEDLRCMTYTDMVIAETLRTHPPAGILIRHCTKTYSIPNSKAVIPEKMPVFISIYGLHMDPKYYARPHEFYPEHFTEEARSKRPACTYVPFGDGPRACIAERFAKMEIKIGLVNMIKDFSFHVSPKMKFPIQYDSQLNIGLMTAKDGVLLQCHRI